MLFYGIHQDVDDLLLLSKFHSWCFPFKLVWIFFLFFLFCQLAVKVLFSHLVSHFHSIVNQTTVFTQSVCFCMQPLKPELPIFYILNFLQSASLANVLSHLLRTPLNFTHGKHLVLLLEDHNVSREVYAKLIWSVTGAVAQATSAGQALTSKAWHSQLARGHEECYF